MWPTPTSPPRGGSRAPGARGLATYRELISNLSTKTKPEGGALTLVLDRWISGVQSQALQETGLEPGSPALTQAVDQKIVAVTSAVSELVHGFEFAKLLSLYYHAYVEGEEEKKQQVARWFRGEYATKREAKEELGVNILITDDNWYEYLKLFAVFFRLAGYAGMMIFIDELVNLYKIPNAITRQYNYEKLPHHVQRHPPGQGPVPRVSSWGATPQAIEDKRPGLSTATRPSAPGWRRGSSPAPAPGTCWPRSSAWSPSPPRRCWSSAKSSAAMHAGLYGYQRAARHPGARRTLSSWSTPASAPTRTSPPGRSSGTLSSCWTCSTRTPPCTLESLMQSEVFTYAKSRGRLR